MPLPRPPQQKLMIWLFWALLLLLLLWVFRHIIATQFNPNSNPHSSQTTEVTEVILKRNRFDSYVVTGSINGHRTTMILDTGATSVTVPAHLAQKMNLPRQGQHWAHTAGGRIQVYATTIKTLAIGQITLHDVRASINPRDSSSQVLLGMSALKSLNWHQKGNQLTIQQQKQ